MPLKKVLVDRDVLVRDQPAARLVLRDPVDQKRRVAIAEAIEEKFAGTEQIELSLGTSAS